MSDPRRLRDDADGLSADELRLLRAGVRPNVPRGAKRAVWLALGAQLSSAVASATASSGGALTVASLAKTASLGLLLGATSVGAVTVAHHLAAPDVPRTQPTSRVPVKAAPATSHAVAPAPEAHPEQAPGEYPAETAPRGPRSLGATRGTEAPVAVAPPAGPSVAAFPTDAPDAESSRVAAARQLLRAGRGREALAALDAVAREFPNGALAQEREALAIEALRASGRLPEARARAGAFLARYPASPHASSVRRALE